jgi:hypothetical protein
MNPVAQGLALGYSAQKLIGFLSKAFPSLAPRIKQAQRNGHSVEQVLGFLSKTMETDLPKGTSQQEVLAATNKNKEQLTKHGLTLAASALAAPLAATAARSVLARALPHALAPQAASLANSNNTPNPNAPAPQPTLPLPTGTNPTAQPQQNTSPQPPNPISPNVPNTSQAAQQPPLSNANAASIPQPPNIQQPKQNSSIVDKLYSGFEKGRDKGFDFESDAFLKVAKRMKSTGEIRSKEDFEKFFNLFDAKKNEGKDLPTALKEASIEYDNQKLSPTEQLTQNEEPQLQEAEQIQEPIEQPEEQEKQNRFEFIGEKDFTIDGKITPENELNIQGMFFKNPKGGVYAFPEDVPEDLKNKGYATNSLKKLIKESKESGISKVSVSDASDESLKLLNPNFRFYFFSSLENILFGYFFMNAQIFSLKLSSN